MGISIDYGTGLYRVLVHDVMIDWSKYEFKINVLALVKAYRMFRKLLRKWRRKDVFQEDLGMDNRRRDGGSSDR